MCMKGVFTAQKKGRYSVLPLFYYLQKKAYQSGQFWYDVSGKCCIFGGRQTVKSGTFKHQSIQWQLPSFFWKWVILINFRDNGIYFGTPIYARTKFFYYYLSPTYVLKFDIDDLFYYSSRKIMKRNGHLFVADYGMQVNILNRYGIRNFAVPGKDYIFWMMMIQTSDMRIFRL